MNSLALLLALALGTMKADPTDSGCVLVEIVDKVSCPLVEEPGLMTMPADPECSLTFDADGIYSAFKFKHLHWLRLCDPEKGEHYDTHPVGKP